MGRVSGALFFCFNVLAWSDLDQKIIVVASLIPVPFQ